LIRSKTAFKSTFVLIALFFLLSGSIRIEKDDRMFMRTSFSPERIEWTKKVLIQFKDSIPDDTLTIFYSNLEKPIGFCRNIHTAVCSDTVCRLVNVTIYWEITGKFLGYSVPGDEELTKKEHEPFLEIDYTRLGEILADSSSLLGLYSPEEITPVKTTIVKADGIT
jgi:hypothetical protein